MAATITWVVIAIDCYPQVEGEANVAFNVHWQCSAMHGAYNSNVYSTCAIPAPTGAFTPYADLTQDQVLGWIWANGVDKAAEEAIVQAQINAQITPTVVQPALPWATLRP